MPTHVHAWYFEGSWRAEVSNVRVHGFGVGGTSSEAIEAATANFDKHQKLASWTKLWGN